MPRGSVTVWLQQLRTGDHEAAQPLLDRYFHRLVGLAQKRLFGTARVAVGAEDVALSAFNSFCLRLGRGEFDKVEDRAALWNLLARMTAFKAINLYKHQATEKQGSNQVRPASDFDQPGATPLALFAEYLSKERDPALETASLESMQYLLDALGDEELRQVALWRMEGCTNREIAKRIKKSVKTVERKLKLIRDTWKTVLERF